MPDNPVKSAVLRDHDPNGFAKGRITEDLARMLMPWRHSGFDVFCGPRIYPNDEKAIDYLYEDPGYPVDVYLS